MTRVITIVMGAKEVSKSELKAKMFEYFRELEKTNEPLVVTDFGKPVLIIQLYKKSVSSDEAFAELRKKGLKIPDGLILAGTEDEWGSLE